MPNPQVIIQPTSYTIASNAKPTIKLVQSSLAATLAANATPLDITPQTTQQAIKQSSNSLQLVSSKQTLTIVDKAPSIKAGQASGVIKAARFERIGIYDYVGAALSATALDSSKVWRIRRLVNNLQNNAKNIQSADGRDSFTSAWSDRLALSYV